LKIGIIAIAGQSHREAADNSPEEEGRIAVALRMGIGGVPVEKGLGEHFAAVLMECPS